MKNAKLVAQLLPRREVKLEYACWQINSERAIDRAKRQRRVNYTQWARREKVSSAVFGRVGSIILSFRPRCRFNLENKSRNSHQFAMWLRNLQEELACLTPPSARLNGGRLFLHIVLHVVYSSVWSWRQYVKQGVASSCWYHFLILLILFSYHPWSCSLYCHNGFKLSLLRHIGRHVVDLYEIWRSILRDSYDSSQGLHVPGQMAS